MVATEYKVLLPDDFRIGDTILIMSRTSNGWKATINNKQEIDFECCSNNNQPQALCIDGWVLVDASGDEGRWEKTWIYLKESSYQYQVGIFKSEQEKAEKLRRNESMYMESVVSIEEKETIQSTNVQRFPPIVSLVKNLLSILIHHTSPKSHIFHSGNVVTTLASCMSCKLSPLC